MRAVLLVLTAFLALAAAQKRVVCYFGGWSVYRLNNGKIDISDIDPTLCTHLIYSFVGLNPDDGSVQVLDPWQDLPDNYGKDGFGRFNKLRELSPGTKTMVAVGGWKESTETPKYSQVMANPSLRRNFVNSVVDLVKKYNFDGFDVDWEYPNKDGAAPGDKQNYVSLLKELRERFDPLGLELSAAVGAPENLASLSYNIPEIAKYLDFINLMTYDFHGKWETETGINAPLYPGSQDANKKLNVDAIVKYWLSQGAPADKLVLGVPLYGRSFTLDNPANNGIGAPAHSPPQEGPYTRESGMLGYNEICEKIRNENWNVVFDEEQRVPYAYGGNQWVGYDDERSIKEKAEYANRMGLGGMMVWSLDTDDFKGLCGGEKFPLLKTINRGIRGGAAPPPSDQPRPTRPPTTTPHYQQNNNQQVNNNNNNNSNQQVQSQPPASSGNVCNAGGTYVRDPQRCDVYYYCQPVNGQYVPVRMSCPATLVYDSNNDRCDYPYNVSC